MYCTYRHILALPPAGNAVGSGQKASQCQNTGWECHKAPSIAIGSLYMFLLPVVAEFNRRGLTRSEPKRFVRPHTKDERHDSLSGHDRLDVASGRMS